MKYINPMNDYTIDIDFCSAWMGTLFLGPLYLAWHGAWGPCILACVLSLLILSVMVSWPPIVLIWIIFALGGNSFIYRAYMRKGWQTRPSDPDWPNWCGNQKDIVAQQVKDKLSHLIRKQTETKKVA